MSSIDAEKRPGEKCGLAQAADGCYCATFKGRSYEPPRALAMLMVKLRQGQSPKRGKGEQGVGSSVVVLLSEMTRMAHSYAANNRHEIVVAGIVVCARQGESV